MAGTSALTLIRAAGFTGTTREGDPADKAALAIMHRESGGRADAVNPAPCSPQGDHAVGLMQICCPMHMSVADAKNPGKNLAKAHQLYKAAGDSFARDWPTYHQGDWRTATDLIITGASSSALSDALKGGLDAANAATGGLAGDAIDAVTGGAGAVTGTVSAVDDIASALLSRDTWFRIGKGALGTVIVVIGVAGIAAIALKPLAKQAAKVPV